MPPIIPPQLQRRRPQALPTKAPTIAQQRGKTSPQPISKPTAPTQPSPEQEGYNQAMQQYKSDLAQYQSQVNELNLWRKAWSLVERKKGFAARGDPQLEGKVRAIQEGRAFAQMKALETGIPKPVAPTKPQVVQTGFDVFGKPVYKSVTPDTLTSREKALTELGMPITTPYVQKFKEAPTEPLSTYKRETISSEPSPKFIKGEGKAPDFFSMETASAVQTGIQTVAGITDLPSRDRPYREGEVFTPVPLPSDVPRRETVTYGQPELTAEGQLERDRMLEELMPRNNAEEELQSEINKVYNKYSDAIQSMINSGKSKKDIDNFIEQSRKNAKVESEKVITELEAKYQQELTARDEKRLDKFVALEFSQKFWRNRVSNLIRAGIYSTPIIGGIVMTSDFAEFGLGLASGEINAYRKKYPTEFWGETGATVATFTLAGSVKGRFKKSAAQKRIATAIDNAKVKLKSRGIITEKDLDLIKMNAEQKLEIKNLLKEGGAIRKYDIELKAAEAFKEDTPKVSGEFVEVLDQRGNLVYRSSVGELHAKLGNKNLNKVSTMEALMKIEQETGKIQGYSELIEATRRQGLEPTSGEMLDRFEEPTITKFYEEGKITKDVTKKVGERDVRFTESEMASELLGGPKKYKGERFLEGYGKGKDGITILPDFEMLKGKGKPYAKGQFREASILTDIKGELITKDGIGLLKTEKISETLGTGIIKRVPEVTKPSIVRKMKTFRDLKVEPVTKYKQPKVTRTQGTIYEPSTPAYVGGKGGATSQGFYYGQQAKVQVPFGGIATTESFISGLPGEFSKGAGRSSFVTGLGYGITSISKMRLGTEMGFKERITEIERTRLTTALSPVIVERTIEKTKTSVTPKVTLIPMQSYSQEIGLRQQMKMKQVSTVPSTSVPFVNLNFKFPGETIIGLPEIEKERPIKQQGYYGEARIDATKKKKAYWKRLNKKPMTKTSALSRSAKFVDENISARGRVVKAPQQFTKKGKLKPVIDTGQNYFGMFREKFRTFKQKKGRRERLPNSFIERSRYRSDMVGEVSQLKQAKRKIQKSRRRTPFGF